MKLTAMVPLLFALTACAPPVPDSGSGTGAGVGFRDYQDYTTYRRHRDAELTGRTTVVPPPTLAPRTAIESDPNPVPGTTPNRDVANTAPPTQTAPVDPNHPGISDEQNFDAVSNRQSIESDAERLRAQRDAYEIIQPTAVPNRIGGGGPNIVEYALSTSNPVGKKVYRRNVILAQSRYERNCAKYASSDLAQEAFLRSGGPQRDKMGLDPDGDGFACGWDPTPFRRINVSGG